MLFVKILLLVLSFPSFAENKGLSKLPKLSTKQDVNNLRFLDQSGKYTYYQRRSGQLVFATNFSVHNVIMGQAGTNYSIVSSPTKKFLAVSMDEHHMTNMDAGFSQKIYSLSYGTDKASLIGMGNDPRLHLNDSWISFYEKSKRIIHFVNIINNNLKFTIQLPLKKNPYFIPSPVMTDKNSVLTIDQNEEGIYGLIAFERNSGKTQVLYKAKGPLKRLEICKNDQSLILGIFDISQDKNGSEILISKQDPIEFKPLYSSALSDIGNIICDTGDNNIYFVKALKENIFELAQLNPSKPKEEQITILSDLQHVSQIIQMDGKLLIPFRGDFYVPMEGETDYIKTENLTDIKETQSSGPTNEGPKPETTL